MLLRFGLIGLLLVVGLSACTFEFVEDPEDVRRTWTRGWIMVPPDVAGTQYGCSGDLYQQATVDCVSAVPAEQQVPLVVYLHGCSGQNYEYPRFLFSVGYASVAPNSMAREYRPRDCEAGPQKQRIVAMRVSEARHAYQQAIAYPWVDPQRVYLMGFSEGGITTAVYPGDEFAAHIILGWTCTHRRHLWADGIRAPQSTPVLAIMGTADKFIASGNQGNCGNRLGDRPRSRYVEISKGVHNVIQYPQAKAAVKTFLDEISAG